MKSYVSLILADRRYGRADGWNGVRYVQLLQESSITGSTGRCQTYGTYSIPG